MGTILFKETEGLLSNKIFDKIPVTNWRTVAELGDNRLEVVIARLHRFVIHDITLDYFHLTNKHRYIIEKFFDYINSPLGCSLCHGAGRIDWVQKARGAKAEPVLNLVRAYVRDKNVTNNLNKDLYGSQPKIFDGQELCSHCLGTGLEGAKTFWLNESMMR